MGETLKRKERDSNIELFRIVSMLLIVMHHYVVNSGLLDDAFIPADYMSAPSIFLTLMGGWGKAGINCFVLITGYFMCTSRITAKKFIKLLFEYYFYRIVITSIFVLCGETLSITSVIKMLIPWQNVGSGFFGEYMLFFLMIPFLTILVQNMTKKQHLYLIALLSFIYILYGTVKRVEYNHVTWFSVLFVISSYVRLHPNKLLEKKSLWGFLTLGSMLAGSFMMIASGWIAQSDFAFREKFYPYLFMIPTNTIFTIAPAFCAFMYFKNLKIGHSKLINAMGASTFGILMIHANSNLMRQWLWCDVFKVTEVFDSKWMPLHAIGSTIVIFVLCAAIDCLMRRWIEEPLFRHFEKRKTEKTA